MFRTPHLLAAAALATFAVTAPAQLIKGGTPPPFEFEKVWNGGPRSFDDFVGKVVVLDFAQTW